VKEKELKAAIIGAGNIGYHHCRILKGMKGVTLCGIAETNDDRRKQICNEFQIDGYSDFKALIAEQHPDFVTVAVPVRQHYSIASECLQNGIHVLLEKPASDRIGEIEHLIETAQKNNRLLSVGHVERFNPAVQALKRLIEKDELGIITNLVARRVGGYPPKLTDIGVFIDLAVHDVDVFRYLIGTNPVKIEVQRLNVHSNTVDDAATAFLQYSSASGLIQVNWITPVKIRQLSVTGTKGHAELNYIEQTLDIYEHNVNPDDFTEKNFVEFLRKYGKPTSRTIHVEHAEPLARELEHFAGAVNGKHELLVKPEEVLETMKIVLSI